MRAIALSAAAALLAATGGCRRAEANPVTGGSPERGEKSFVLMGCASCHTVRGIEGPQGKVGPVLTGIAERSYIAGELPNTPENMMDWIMNPQGIKPGTAMPNLGVGPQVARDIAAFLYTRR